MAQYLFSMFHDGPPPPDSGVDLEQIGKELAALREELTERGAWVFGNGLHPASAATVVRPVGDEIVLTDGPYLEGKEHLGGVTIIDVADLDEALAWARRYQRVVHPLAIEVRPFQG